MERLNSGVKVVGVTQFGFGTSQILTSQLAKRPTSKMSMVNWYCLNTA